MKKLKFTFMTTLLIIIVIVSIIALNYYTKTNEFDTNNINEISNDLNTDDTNTIKVPNKMDNNSDNFINFSIRRDLKVLNDDTLNNTYKCYYEKNELMVPIDMIVYMINSNNNEYIYILEGPILKIGAKTNIENGSKAHGYIEININSGEAFGRNIHGYEVASTMLSVLAKYVSDTIYVPLVETYNLLTTYSIFIDKNINLIRYELQDFELNFLEDFPHTVIGYEITNDILIFKSNGKYGIVKYDYSKGTSSYETNYLGYNIVLEAKYDDITYPEENDYIGYSLSNYILKSNYKYFLYDYEKEYISQAYDSIKNTRNYFIVELDNKYGLYGAKSHQETLVEYDGIEEIRTGNGLCYYILQKNNMYGIYGHTDIIYEKIWAEDESYFVGDMGFVKTTIYGMKNGKKVVIQEEKNI